MLFSTSRLSRVTHAKASTWYTSIRLKDEARPSDTSQRYGKLNGPLKNACAHKKSSQLDPATQVIKMVTPPATKTRARVSCLKAFSGRRGPTMVPRKLPRKAPGSQSREAGNRAWTAKAPCVASKMSAMLFEKTK